MTDTVNDNPDTQEVAFYASQDGIRGRDGGPYFDYEDRLSAELRRAKAEDREPDLDNPPPTVGTHLVTAAQLTDNIPSNPSMINAPGLPQAILEHKDNPDFLTSPVQVFDIDVRTEPSEEEVEDAETPAQIENSNDPAVVDEADPVVDVPTNEGVTTPTNEFSPVVEGP
jgi:hypothetical protein